MLFENLHVGRVVVHEVFQRGTDRRIKTPAYSDHLEALSAEAMGAFRLRLTDALAGEAQSLQMDISRTGADSFLHVANEIIGCDDGAFIESSKAIANHLAEAQTSRSYPGGLLIVFDGTVGAPAVPFVGAIKAETQEGFRRHRNGEQVLVEFVENIFLTPATRLYKIGLMLREDPLTTPPEGWRAHVFDSNISKNNRENAAAYFYEAFLGCVLPSDGSYQTAKFFDLTKQFIQSANLTPDQQRDLHDSLYVFVKDEQAPTFTAEQFNDRYIPEGLQAPYTEFMEAKKFPSHAVVRDTSKMGSRLRRRRMKFGSEIELRGSPTALQEKVTVSNIKGEPVEGQTPTWTQIIVRETYSGEA